MENESKKHIWVLILEYFLAAPILGLPCYATIPVWLDREGLVIAGAALVGVFYILLAFYQLGRTRVFGTQEGIIVYVLLGIIFIILSLMIAVYLFQSAPAVPVSANSGGTASPTNVRGTIIVIATFTFSFLIGFAVLFLGYARLELVADLKEQNEKRSSPNHPQ
jgi:preprotein translocase subunit SecG